MNQEIFADGFSAIQVTGNVVQMALTTLQSHLKSKNKEVIP